VIEDIDRIEDEVNETIPDEEDHTCGTFAMFMILARRLTSMGWAPEELSSLVISESRDQKQMDALSNWSTDTVH
jgi:hypothetical protein